MDMVYDCRTPCFYYSGLGAKRDAYNLSCVADDGDVGDDLCKIGAPKIDGYTLHLFAYGIAIHGDPTKTLYAISNKILQIFILT